MQIINRSGSDYNFEERLRPLFEAMEEGRKIKSLTYSAGNHKKEDESSYVTVKNFLADTYYVAIMTNSETGEKYDYVYLTGHLGVFAMHWVVDYEL